ncbi:hypothetical protein SADUNF_Sadunf10G0186800 [Salix dunnii]|uniref:FAF domain-containing protein n=1 Tax=Salix dunnii TaxID=1413687 RepID=A0A835MQB6_9ROSI|nr:hypothetical protein SADUNF_Sadunf10G0186800 [Salix dunnii]
MSMVGRKVTTGWEYNMEIERRKRKSVHVNLDLEFIIMNLLQNRRKLQPMEGNGFSSVKDSPTSQSHPSPALVGSQSIPATWGSASFPSTHIETTVVDGFFYLSLGWTSLSSINSLYATSPSSSSSTDCLSDVMSSTGACFNQKEEIMNVDAEKHVAFGNSTKKKGLFPPPISCLKLFNKGIPYRYLIYNEENDSFKLEEIKILQGDILRANRSGGRSRLAFVVSDDESSDIEEEEETNGTVE